jgi:hypothetical protein
MHHTEIIITKYGIRHWAVWLGSELVAVTVYKKGAARVAELLQRPQNALQEDTL